MRIQTSASYTVQGAHTSTKVNLLVTVDELNLEVCHAYTTNYLAYGLRKNNDNQFPTSDDRGQIVPLVPQTTLLMLFRP